MANKELETVDFEYECRYYADTRTIFRALTDPMDQMRYTMAPATGEPKEGAEWTLFGGVLRGKWIELVEGEKIVTTWGFRDWPDGCTSTVTITLRAKGPDTTYVHLKQTGIPRTDKYGNSNVETNVMQGWKDKIFIMIKQRLGYGFEQISD